MGLKYSTVDPSPNFTYKYILARDMSSERDSTTFCESGTSEDVENREIA